MPDYGLFLTFQFRGDGNFDDNGRQRIRRPDARFWDLVLPDRLNPGGNNFITRSTRLVEVLGSNPVTFAPESTRINADTRTMEMIAREPPDPEPTDRVFFGVNLIVGPGPNPPVVSNIRFACSVHPGLKVSKSSVASPFRLNGEIQCHLTAPPNRLISSIDPENPASPPVIFKSIGPYSLSRDPGPTPGGRPLRFECCFHKLTLVATATRAAVGGSPALTREYAYDPDMDIEMGL